MKKRFYKGFILKKDFCKEYNITYKVFDKIMIEKGFLERNLISTNSEGINKYGLGIISNNLKEIRPYNGTWKQGVHQYNLNLLKTIFSK